MNSKQQYLAVFFDEKKLDERTYEVKSPNGTPNFIPSSVVIEMILRAPAAEQEYIGLMIRRMDFANSNVHNYLAVLAQALAVDM